MVKTGEVLHLIEQGIDECISDEYIIDNVYSDKNTINIDFVSLITNEVNTYKITVELV